MIKSSWLLWALGWQPIEPSLLRNILEKTTPGVVLFPHTSNWDFIIMVAYLWTYPELRAKVRVVTNRVQFDRWSRLMRWCSALSAPMSSDGTKAGTVERAVAVLRDNPDTFVLLSPKGTRSARAEWSSGWYWIMRRWFEQNRAEKKFRLSVIGLDYSAHCVRFPLSYSMTEPSKEICGPSDQETPDSRRHRERLEEELVRRFARIPQLWPQCEVPLDEEHQAICRSDPPTALGRFSPIVLFFFGASMLMLVCAILAQK